MSMSGVMLPAGAGVVGGKLGSYFGNWVGDELGVGGKNERTMFGSTLGGAATGAAAGAAVGGIGAIPGALIGGAAGLISSLF